MICPEVLGLLPGYAGNQIDRSSLSEACCFHLACANPGILHQTGREEHKESGESLE